MNSGGLQVFFVVTGECQNLYLTDMDGMKP